MYISLLLSAKELSGFKLSLVFLPLVSNNGFNSLFMDDAKAVQQFAEFIIVIDKLR